MSTTEKKSPLKETQAFCLETIKDFQAQLDTFQLLAEKNADKNTLIQQFKKCRIYFKKFEFICEYYDNVRYPFFNGANAIEMEYGYNPNAKPEGLQVIESELFNDSLDRASILYLTKQLKYRTLSFYIILRDSNLQDAYIFEAIRYNLIRIETLGLVSFDSPLIRNNVEEIISSLQTIFTVLEFYPYDLDNKKVKSISVLLSQCITYLDKKNFENLDRLYFIKQHLQPLVKEIKFIQQANKIIFSKDIYANYGAVNLNANSIYDVDFINLNFYSSNKLFKENDKKVALGKQLFFDKRLSLDGSMSCATCHQPAQFFTDKLPRSITNIPGEFQLRNTPSLLNVAFQSAFFYDFKATTLENQIDHVVVNPLEFNHNFDSIKIYLDTDTLYSRLFSQAFPGYSHPSITIEKMKFCLSSFQRKMVFLNSTFDKYMRGEQSKLNSAVKRGFNLFMGKAQCGSCHFAPTYFGLAPPFYTTSESEVLGLTKTFDTIHPVIDDDIGRYKINEFDFLKFSMKTSTVRNTEFTAPYMHNGGFKTLEEVIEFYNIGGGLGMGLDIPNQTLLPNRLQLSSQEKKDLISFIKSLSDTSSISNLQ